MVHYMPRKIRFTRKSPGGYKSDRYYADPQYKAFRDAVRKRDKHKCQWPNCTEMKPSKLQVHHIRCWESNPYLRFNPDNGITLCKIHHKIVTGNEDNYLALFLQIVARNKL